jgi:hypothetical protein
MKLSGLSYKRSRFHGKTQSIMLSILITRPKKATLICVSSQGKLVDGMELPADAEKIDCSSY